MSAPGRVERHAGVYAVLMEQGGLVVVRKSRGPYLGLLDLPGGTPEPGESAWETLRRELAEEVGARLIAAEAWCRFELRVRRSSTGEPIDFRHSGRVAVVNAAERRLVAPAEDIRSVHLRRPAGLRAGECSAPLAWVLRRGVVACAEAP